MIPKYKAYIIKENRIVDVEGLHWNKGYGGALEIHVHNPNWSVQNIIDNKPYDHNNPPFFTYINHTDKVWLERKPHEFVLLPFSGILDRNKKEIYHGDTIVFADKWEWYRTKYGISMMLADKKRKKELQKQYDAEPLETRIVNLPEDYEWLLSSEIQTYWEVTGSSHIKK
jgi:uncharacterized protein YbaR (Trm112 family)